MSSNEKAQAKILKVKEISLNDRPNYLSSGNLAFLLNLRSKNSPLKNMKSLKLIIWNMISCFIWL